MNIFLMGKAGSGKDSVAEILRANYGFYPVALADKIREEYRRFLPGKDPRQDREKLIQIGETYKQIYGKDIWVRELAAEINFIDCWELPNHILVVDGRHQVEYDYFVDKMGYAPVWIECPEEIRLQRLMRRDGTVQANALAQECKELWTAAAISVDNSGSMKELEMNLAILMALLETVGSNKSANRTFNLSK